MTKYSRAIPFCIFSIAVCAMALHAGQTRTWSQNEFADFEKGALKNLSFSTEELTGIDRILAA